VLQRREASYFDSWATQINTGMIEHVVVAVESLKDRQLRVRGQGT
jgi:hypothetical protein